VPDLESEDFSEDQPKEAGPAGANKGDPNETETIEEPRSTVRSRRGAVKKSYADLTDSETEEDESDSEDERFNSRKDKKDKKRTKVAPKAPASKRKKTTTAPRTPLVDVKNKRGNLASPSTPSIKELTSQMWVGNEEDWRSFSAVDY